LFASRVIVLEKYEKEGVFKKIVPKAKTMANANVRADSGGMCKIFSKYAIGVKIMFVDKWKRDFSGKIEARK